MFAIGPVEASAFSLREPGSLRTDCGFEPDLVATGPDGGAAWGAVSLRERDGTVSVRFWVAPERRGRRLGAAMLRALAPQVFEAGAPRLETRVPVWNLAAVRTAMRAGFRPDAGVSRAAAPDGSDALTLGRLPGDGHGPAPRVLPDLPGGELTDGTVSLRPLTTQHSDAHRRHRQSPDVYSGAALQLPPSAGEATEMCRWRAAVDWLRGRAALMVIDDGAGYRGTVGLYDVALLVGTGMIGYDLTARARGRGYATRAVALVCRWAFDEVGLDRIWAGTDVHNTASQAVLRRSGFRLEGTERGGLPSIDGTRRDTLLWAKLCGDR